ncbi:hypothetical protein [Pedobacter sp. SL55]|uniref:hypothetical protein n=1 Tax=Pedobacter sp. SL55 TaxID=2995161 RepID=UPI0022720F58|nr:hypothetical protein [Pedobacter sp. SL55]WAC41195.1 hypothetical protein OVA16_02130 [Pedobacter sp. SL55]
MLKLNLLVMFLSLTIASGNCQTKTDSEKIKIHQSVITKLKKEGEKFHIYPSTRKASLSSFDFTGGGRGLDTNSNRAWNNKEWISFVKNIDTSSISDYPIYLNSNREKRKELIFAPIFFSKDGTKALAIAKFYSYTSQTGSGMAWFFERDNNVWKVKDMQIFSTIN